MPPKRKRETRMDAAIDSMEQYGFPSKLVRQTVHHLLKVYGGSHGWVFIEDAAYSLLIETLLEKPQHQQQPPSASASASAQPQPQPHVAKIEDNLGDDHSEAQPAGSSNRALLPCSNSEMFDDSSITNQAVDNVSVAIESGDHLPIKVEDTVPAAASKTCIQLPVKPVDTLSPPSETSKRHPVKAVNTVSATCEIDRKPARDFASGEIHGTPLACPPLQTKLPQPVESLHHQRRKPCFGWISDDDDDDEEEEKPIELPPAPLFLK